MNPTYYRELKLGILGGGQLGRMLIQASIDYNVHIECLDPAADAPCRPYAHAFSQGKLTDYDTVMAFGADKDVITIEIENVNTEALEALQLLGKRVFPDPKTIRMIQDKRTQKQFFRDHDLPTADFVLTETQADTRQHAHRLPAVHKLGREGYDGRGVQMIRTEADLDKAFDRPALLEDLVAYEKEIAFIISRNPQGEIAVFPPVEMVFHPEHNLVEYLFAPASLSPAAIAAGEDICRRLVSELEYVGVLAVEMFYLPDGQWLINEIAPRPHNSGHHTIRANYTSQYEQHLRAILGLPLGDTCQHTAAAMVNLLGAEGHSGPVVYTGLEAALAIPGVYPHFYGKAETRPFRKMGHVTIIGPAEQLPERVAAVRDLIRVESL